MWYKKASSGHLISLVLEFKCKARGRHRREDEIVREAPASIKQQTAFIPCWTVVIIPCISISYLISG